MAVYQVQISWLANRFRRQASSHMLDCVWNCESGVNQLPRLMPLAGSGSAVL